MVRHVSSARKLPLCDVLLLKVCGVRVSHDSTLAIWW
jgi:hypothetical protein